MIKFKKILFPTDLFPSESYALDYAISLALEHEAAIYLLHVIDVASSMSPYILTHFPKTPEHHLTKGDRLLKELQEVISPQLKRQVHVEEIVVKSTAYQEILRIAKEKRIDLIVISSRRRVEGNQDHLESTSERVINSAPCPVLLVRQPNADATVAMTGSLSAEVHTP